MAGGQHRHDPQALVELDAGVSFVAQGLGKIGPVLKPFLGVGILFVDVRYLLVTDFFNRGEDNALYDQPPGLVVPYLCAILADGLHVAPLGLRGRICVDGLFPNREAGLGEVPHASELDLFPVDFLKRLELV